MPHTFVKICGITTTDAAETVAEAGADAIGFVFAPGSVRAVSAEQATSLVAAVAGQLETVGVFRNQPIDEVLSTASQAGLTTVQLHGDEPDSDVDALRRAGFRTIRAVSIDAYRALRSREESGTASRAAGETDPTRLLIDAVSPGGGTLFDTSELETTPPTGFWILAGGLTPDNVGDLVSGVRPGGVDVSSGVESRRGVKDLALIRDFVQAVR